MQARECDSAITSIVPAHVAQRNHISLLEQVTMNALGEASYGQEECVGGGKTSVYSSLNASPLYRLCHVSQESIKSAKTTVMGS